MELFMELSGQRDRSFGGRRRTVGTDVHRARAGRPIHSTLHLLVLPIAVRKGMRLFDEGETPIPLRLISSETFQDRRPEPRLGAGLIGTLPGRT
jgi:hypothetical protein